MKRRIQLRCIGCQAIGYREVEDSDFGHCPKCDCCLTDWVKVPNVRAALAIPKAAFFEQRKPEHLEGDMREMNGSDTGFMGRKVQRLEDRDDFLGL